MQSKTKVNMFMRSQNGKKKNPKQTKPPKIKVSEKHPDRTGSGTLLYILFSHSCGTALSKQGIVPNRFFICTEQAEKIFTGQRSLLLSSYHGRTKVTLT